MVGWLKKVKEWLHGGCHCQEVAIVRRLQKRVAEYIIIYSRRKGANWLRENRFWSQEGWEFHCLEVAMVGGCKKAAEWPNETTIVGKLQEACRVVARKLSW